MIIFEITSCKICFWCTNFCNFFPEIYYKYIFCIQFSNGYIFFTNTQFTTTIHLSLHKGVLSNNHAHAFIFDTFNKAILVKSKAFFVQTLKYSAFFLPPPLMIPIIPSYTQTFVMIIHVNHHVYDIPLTMHVQPIRCCSVHIIFTLRQLRTGTRHSNKHKLNIILYYPQAVY